MAGIDVVGLGSVTWDRRLETPRFPVPGDKLRAIRTEEFTGGSVATALIALARWGLASRLLGLIGADEAGDRIIADLTAESIDMSAVGRSATLDGRHATIIIDHRNGSVAEIHSPPPRATLQPEPFTEVHFAGARVLHLDTSYDEAALHAARLAKSHGLTVTLNADRFEPGTDELMRLCDYVIASLDFARRATEQEKPSRAAYALSLRTERPVLVRAGEEGCFFANEELALHQPAHETTVVDTTGAGDVFQAAFIYGLLAAWDFRRLLRFATWAGSHACREIGGRKGIPTLAAVHDFVRADRME